jgi:hypothetical protein
VETIYLRQAFAALANDVEQDFVIWKHKQYVARPALAQGDGPIARYRRWAEQFYPLSKPVHLPVVPSTTGVSG